MMKSIQYDPNKFDGAKFMARYSLAQEEFWAKGNTLFFPDRLPDKPTLEPPDPPPTRPPEADKVINGTATATDMAKALKWAVAAGRLNLEA